MIFFMRFFYCFSTIHLRVKIFLNGEFHVNITVCFVTTQPLLSPNFTPFERRATLVGATITVRTLGVLMFSPQFLQHRPRQYSVVIRPLEARPPLQIHFG